MSLRAVVAVLVLVALAVGIEGLPARNLDEGIQPPPSSGVKCTMCTSCSNPCYQEPPPPPPSPPHPPKKPKTPYCPPPPPPYFIVIGGPPGYLYPVYQSAVNRNFIVELPVFVGCGLLGLLVFWRL